MTTKKRQKKSGPQSDTTPYISGFTGEGGQTFLKDTGWVNIYLGIRYTKEFIN